MQTYENGVTQRIYAGVLRNQNNLFVSEDAGATWSVVPNRPVPQYATTLMPQRIAIRPDGSEIYVTWGNGAGPHTMMWDEGWGMINDWFNRGAVFKYNLQSKTWTNISPQNLIDPAGEKFTDPSVYFGCYSGVSVNPQNPNILVVSSIASYRGTQYWKIDGKWKDVWGDNIFVSPDAGKTWVPSFRYYWIEGGFPPTSELMDANGYPWIVGNTIHWIGGVCIDPFNPKRVFVTSGNGVFMTENIMNYRKYLQNTWDKDSTVEQNTVWKFSAKGIEEVVPDDIISMKKGPVVSAIWDYDGFRHDDVTKPSPLGRHKTNVGGAPTCLGSTPGMAVATKSGKLAKVAKIREVKLQYNSVPIGPVQYSSDSGKTWTVETYTSNPPVTLYGGKVALSADGAITLWMPSDSITNTTTHATKQATTMYRNENSSWSVVKGISFNTRPVADAVDSKKFYAYNTSEGYIYTSIDAGKTFTKAGNVGVSDYKTIRTTPDSTGHLWIPLAKTNNKVRSGGLKYSTDGGQTFKSIAGITYCEAVGFGKAADGASYPTIFALAEINSVIGVFRSTDKGASWQRVNDEEHEYGGLANGEFVVGDMNIFGRVYMSTAGRGIVYGEEGEPLDASTQYIDLVAGWNLITINKQAADMSIKTLFPNAKTVKNDTAFFGAWQDAALNSLNVVVAGEAYFVYNNVDERISIKGTTLANKTKTLHAGWNLLGYPKTANSNIVTAINLIAPQTDVVKNFNGFWMPNNPVTNSIIDFEAGKGYFIHVSAQCDLSF